MPDISLKERLAGDSILVVPAAFDMVSAKVIEEGTTQAIVAEMTNFGDFNDLIGFPEVRAFEAK